MVDYTLDNQPGASFRAELNLILAALAENAYDSTEPTTTFPGQWWVDAAGASPIVKMRNASDSGWVSLGTLDAGGFQVAGTTPFIRTLLDDVDAATARGTLGLTDAATLTVASNTFTAEVADALSGGNTASVSSASGRYYQVGKLVHVECRIQDINTSGMSSGNAIYIRGLPNIDVAGSPQVPVMGGDTSGVAGGSMLFLSHSGSLTGQIKEPDSTGTMTVGELSASGGDLFFSGTFESA